MENPDSHADGLLSNSFKRFRYLTPLDRAFLTELTYGVLRWRGRLDWAIQQFSKTPLEKIEAEIVNILRLGLYQILFLSRTPVSAAVNESAELAKKTRGKGGAGFVNAILRSVLRAEKEIPYPDFKQDPALHIAIVHSHPLWLVQRWIEEIGAEKTIHTCTINNQISPLTLRINSLTTSRENLIQKLKEKGLAPFPTEFSSDGIRLENPPPTSELPFLKEGLYIIQDEASQLVTSVLDPKPGEKILDACAAPGGKTTHIAQRMENRGEIFATDLHQEKLNRIEDASHRLGIRIVKTIRGDAAQPLPFPIEVEFDRVLADVPCSGFGTLQKNPDLKWKRREEDICRLSELQSSIVKNLSGYVKKGGILVYSTCTVFREENEGVVEKFLTEHTEFQLDRIGPILPEKCSSFIESGYFKTFPLREKMDGFFVARMVRR
ncbi:MAG: 16S rRNA (cytosine(967)-C(5))-methyltransferase [Deltaproteobacteria bacterium RBG_16_48_10]|nr:MAG: 16S rRNA (cytosine(967)-C(5))-methyltransferase [Deltaproteobacteria bacterium RBG_16_48_10]